MIITSSPHEAVLLVGIRRALEPETLSNKTAVMSHTTLKFIAMEQRTSRVCLPRPRKDGSPNPNLQEAARAPHTFSSCTSTGSKSASWPAAAVTDAAVASAGSYHLKGISHAFMTHLRANSQSQVLRSGVL